MIRWKGRDRGRQPRPRLSVAGEERRQRFAVGEIESAASGHQEFTPRRRHGVEDGDLGAALNQHFRRHEPGRAGSDHGGFGFEWKHGVSLRQLARHKEDRHSGMRRRAQARNPYPRLWLWIPGSSLRDAPE